MVDTTGGLVMVHSTPSALCPHIEWAVGGVLGAPVELVWRPQTALPGHLRTEFSWRGAEGTGARLASAFLAWRRIRYEVTEDQGSDGEGHRWSYTPDLGIFHASTNVHGDVMVPEDRLRSALAADNAGTRPLREGLHELLGTAWDQELEIFRQAAEDDSVRWMDRAV
ncbi:DUF3145 domain-containing protein [Luteococcus sp. Sow4_B9]|uniref:DUF3145 domain-containing protein n=1 Tax=Luteococcus sp. Sow4_B9 TaxID=3438792 RepID=UPI003F9E9068